MSSRAVTLAQGGSRPTAAQWNRLRWVLLPLIVFMVMYAGMALRSLYMVHETLSRFQPIPATVLRSGVEEIRGKGASTGSFRPVIFYGYTVDGTHYVSSHATPRNESGGERWARDLAATYAAGQTIIAYFDPAQPGSAFLVRNEHWVPMLLLVFPIIVLALLLSLARRELRTTR